jgi:hypothetical protein
LRQASASSSEAAELQKLVEKLQDDHTVEIQRVQAALTQKEQALSELSEQIVQV